MRRLVADWAVPALVGAAVFAALVWTVDSGLATKGEVNQFLVVAGVPLLAVAVWLMVRGMSAPRDEWDALDDDTNGPA